MDDRLKQDIRNAMRSCGVEARHISRISSGIEGNSFFIGGHTENYVLRIYPTHRHEILSRHISLLTALNGTQSLAIRPIHAKPLYLTKREQGVAYRHVPGIKLSQAQLNDKHFRFGSIVGKFSAACHQLHPWQFGNGYLLRNITAAKAMLPGLSNWHTPPARDSHDLIRRALALLDLEYGGAPFTIQFVHGDMHMDNIIYNPKSGQATVIDIMLREAPVACDIATAISCTLTCNVRHNLHILHDIMLSYNREFWAPPNDLARIPILMLVRKLEEIRYLFGRARTDNSFVAIAERRMSKTNRQLRSLLCQYAELSAAIRPYSEIAHSKRATTIPQKHRTSK